MEYDSTLLEPGDSKGGTEMVDSHFLRLFLCPEKIEAEASGASLSMLLFIFQPLHPFQPLIMFIVVLHHRKGVALCYN